MSGFNPLRWDCERDGCFNKTRRPKIEVFSTCFPGGINFGDVDGMVEFKGCFGFLEWKGGGGSIKTGQRIAYERFTESSQNIVFCVQGNAETMVVEGYSVFWKGKQRPYQQADLDDVKQAICWWVKHVFKDKAA